MSIRCPHCNKEIDEMDAFTTSVCEVSENIRKEYWELARYRTLASQLEKTKRLCEEIIEMINHVDSKALDGN